MNTRNEIANTIAEYFKSQPVNKAWIFGSFARGEETQASDIDIAVTLVLAICTFLVTNILEWHFICLKSL